MEDNQSRLPMEDNPSEAQPLILRVCCEHAHNEDAQNPASSCHERLAQSDVHLKSKKQSMIKSNRTCSASCGLSDPDMSSIDARAKAQVTQKLWFAVGFCLLFMVVEIVGGLMANSLAILADAAHLLSDIASFSISLFAVWASGWKATLRQSYGFHRLEILGALLSILIIWQVTGFLVYEAIDRLIHEIEPINGRLMFLVAALGLLANLVMVCILGHDHRHDKGHEHGHDHSHRASSRQCNCSGTFCSCDTLKHGHTVDREVELQDSSKAVSDKHTNLNLKGAYLHIIGDLIQSVGVVISGAIIWFNPRLRFVDLLCTLMFSVLVLWTTVRMLRDVIEILMESTPREVDAARLKSGLSRIPYVLDVHELHIWAITTGKIVLACHVRIKHDADPDLVLQQVIDYCDREHKISHVTIQIEREVATTDLEI